jgi:tartrate dehydrogenase/decarboxylase/D-malate dehydrogenase
VTAAKQVVAVIAGDGIGLEIMPVALECITRAASYFAIGFDFVEYDWGSQFYSDHGRMMPLNGIELLAKSDAILLGAVGTPEIPDVETLWGLLIPIRRSFEQYINLRPVKTLPGIPGPLADPRLIDFVIVRENNEGEYSEVGGRTYRGLPQETAYQQATFSRFGIERAARFAADLAQRRSGYLVSATKSNGIVHTMPFWDEIVAEVVVGYPGVRLEPVLVDALAARMVLRPWSLDVVVASNLFGDILSDLGSALTGSIGVAPSANLNPERRHPSMFEPVHGSAPDIAGKGIANPVGQLWAAALMLDHLGHAQIAELITTAIEAVLVAGVSTADLGGSASTAQFAAAVLAKIDELAHARSATSQAGERV